MGWSILMSVCACGRDDLAGFALDRTEAVDCATITNKTTFLHLTAMSRNTRVIEELIATGERQEKIRQIIDQQNAHGDTALMMACVAKNVTAVQRLVELGAKIDVINVSGLSALMCAARVGRDPRSGALPVEEMMMCSAVIIENLLLNGAKANVVEKEGGNTALHLAVLSDNIDAVKSLVQNALNLDITLRNKERKTALELSKQSSGMATMQMEQVLSNKWDQCTREAAKRCAMMEQELLDLSIEDNGNKLSRSKLRKRENKTKKLKKRTKAVQKMSEDVSTRSKPTQDEPELSKIKEKNENFTPPSSLNDTQVVEKVAMLDLNCNNFENRVDCDDGDWLRIVSRKNRCKNLGSKYENPHDSLNDKMIETTQTNIIRKSISSQATQAARSKHSKASLNVSTVIEAPGSEQLSLKVTTAIATVSPRRQVLSEDDENESLSSNLSYDGLNKQFHSTFPVAAELEIDVEKFLIASSTSDRELEPYDTLSISQVEALQEAHWQAFHYLNEKKIELTSVLEAQRIEARFALQQELMQIQ
ncbi:Ankyrin [Plasmopara halstedii]|uniref:Ankyrin n=1 Tax=Plasmopara halstedii TaxID=4781 RepID=A0A0P1AIY9_PLAHL|nr:Ankyrin [Plasmopara halstedii]CEG40738.1 Ankyrin [Plasmopara halstedii]|eukprot:XP_024577107.1 Ankyrin [Plasmopara halstedii]